MPAAEAKADIWWTPARKRLWSIYAVVGLAWAAHSAISEWRQNHAFLINATDSLPNWAFLIENDRTPERGQYVFFNPPRSALVARHFGAEPSMFGKIVYGAPGDVVTRRGRTFYVEGRPVAVAKERSKDGEPLALGPTGTLPPGCYFVGTPHRDGFDSRYGEIGWICRERLVGVGTAIL